MMPPPICSSFFLYLVTGCIRIHQTNSLCQLAFKIIFGINKLRLCFQVDVGNGEFIHLRIYQTLPHAGQTLHLDGIQTGKTEKDELVYFEKQP